MDVDAKALRTLDPVEQIVRFSRFSPLPACIVAAGDLERKMTAMASESEGEGDDVDGWFSAGVGCSPTTMRCVDLQRRRIRERYVRDVADHVAKFCDVETRRAGLVRSAVREVKDGLQDLARRKAIVDHLSAARTLTDPSVVSASGRHLLSVCEEEAREAAASTKKKTDTWLARLGHLVATGQCDRVLTAKELAEVMTFFSGV